MDLSITVNELSTVERQLQITVPAATVSRKLDEYYQGLGRTVRLKGFRPGKIPRAVLERYYKKQVESEVTGKLINESYQNALAEHNISPVSQPIIDSPKLELGKDFSFTARVEVAPVVDLQGGYLGIEVEQEKLSVTEEDVERYLEEIRHFHAQLETVKTERQIQPGDFIVIDYTGHVDGVPLQEGEVKDRLLEVKPDSFLPGFTNRLIGLHTGDSREVTLTVPDDFEQKEIAGKTLTFQVAVKEIREKVVPPLDDQFARDVGEFESLAELREKIREEITTRETRRIENALRQDLIQEILKRNPFEVPPALVAQQTEYLIYQARVQMQRQGLPIDSSSMINRELRESYRPMAEYHVKRSFLLAEIAKREGIELAPEEVKEHVAKLAGEMGRSASAFSEADGDDQGKERLKARLLEEKALAFLTEKAHIKVVEKPKPHA